MKLEKQVNQPSVNFKYEIGSSEILLNGVKKYLDIVIWEDTTYEEVKEHIL